MGSNRCVELKYHGYKNAMVDIVRLPEVANLCFEGAKNIQRKAEIASAPVGDTACTFYVTSYISQLGNRCYVVGTQNWASMRRNGKDNTLLKGLKSARK